MNCHTPCYSYDRITNIALTSQRKMLVEQFFDHLQLLHCFVILRYPSAHFSGNWISRDFSLKVICLDCKVLTHQQIFFNLFFSIGMKPNKKDLHHLHFWVYWRYCIQNCRSTLVLISFQHSGQVDILEHSVSLLSVKHWCVTSWSYVSALLGRESRHADLLCRVDPGQPRQ